VADALRERLPVDFRVAARRRVAVPYVVQIDGRKIGRPGEPLEAAGDRVRVRRGAVLPAEQPAAIVVVRPEFLPFLIELLDVRPENREGERRQWSYEGA
jgi:hypothetical protein